MKRVPSLLAIGVVATTGTTPAPAARAFQIEVPAGTIANWTRPV